MVQVTEDEVVIDVSIERGVLIGIPIGITLWNTVGYIARVDGISMQPTLNPDLRHPDFVFLSRWAIRNQTIQRGEIVSVRSPKDQNHILIKRVIGLAGDIVYSHGYRLTVVEVPSGHCWLEGDHIGHSLDSNSFGPVSLGLITAKALCIVWPPSRWRYFYPSMRNRSALELASTPVTY